MRRLNLCIYKVKIVVDNRKNVFQPRNRRNIIGTANKYLLVNRKCPRVVRKASISNVELGKFERTKKTLLIAN